MKALGCFPLLWESPAVSVAPKAQLTPVLHESDGGEEEQPMCTCVRDKRLKVGHFAEQTQGSEDIRMYSPVCTHLAVPRCGLRKSLHP